MKKRNLSSRKKGEDLPSSLEKGSEYLQEKNEGCTWGGLEARLELESLALGKEANTSNGTSTSSARRRKCRRGKLLGNLEKEEGQVDYVKGAAIVWERKPHA